MRALPILQCRTVPAEFIVQYECSDRLLVAKNIQASQNLQNTPCILRISNVLDAHVVGTVYGFHDDDDIIYMPMWMMNSLKVTNNVTISCVPINTCTKATIKPYNAGLFEIDDWHIKLRNGLRQYSTLTRGDLIPMNIDGIIYFSVEMLYPRLFDTIYLIGSGEMEIDIRASFELENIIAKKDKTAALIHALTPIVAEIPQAPDYSKIPYLAIVPLKIREMAIYDAIDIFSGKGNRLGP